MKLTMTRPCDNCPFLRDGGIRLNQPRVREICRSQLSGQGATFSCHKTVNYDDDREYVRVNTEQYCAGALIFAEKNQTANQFLRIMMRIGSYNPDLLDKSAFDKVFKSQKEMLAVNRKENDKT